MRFRRIEKDMGGMANVGLKDQHIQGKEDDVTTSNSKTYIGSKGNKKLAMNKIKNTKVGDDIHYYINGQEGRGIVVKMANEYLEVFKEDGQLGTIHINDTFFVKDILINKQWDDMDNIERYEALTKIHAPSPRYITKQWNDIPEEIKVLLQKQMPGGTGSTYEQGESKDSETQDHSRTGFAQNTQYSKKGEEEIIKAGYDQEREHYLRRRREKKEKETGIMQAGNPDFYTLKNPKWKGDESKIPRPYVTRDFKTGKETLNPGKQKGYWHTDERKHRHMRRDFHKDDEKQQAEYEKRYQDYDKKETERETAAASQAKEAKTTEAPKEKPKKKPTPSDSCPTCGTSHPGLVHEKTTDDDDDWENPMSTPKTKAFYKQWLAKKKPRPSPRTAHGSFGTTQSEAGQEAQQSFSDATTSAASALGVDFGTATKTYLEIMKPQAYPKGSKYSKTDVCDEKGVCPDAVFEGKEHITPNEQKTLDQEDDDREKLSPHGEEHGDLVESKDPKHKKRVKEIEAEEKKLEDTHSKIGRQPANPKKKSDAFRKLKPVYEGDTKQAKDTQKAYEVWLERRDKSDVEHGRYSNPGGTPEVGVSTDTKVDVTTGTGYEERPHISVEEAGKLPRSTFNESGSELTVSGSQDSKDEPKFSQPADQEQPVRKAGLPQQHPNTYGVRYGMKGGVKKVWCPEHQMWEETRKDWHE